MEHLKGKLIVLDGTDGSGKATQTKKLVERLQNEGLDVRTLDFPRYYDNFFGGLAGDCLAGNYGDWADIDPHIASVIYAADRWESSEQLRTWLDDGATVILDRYVSSNQIHQGGKIVNDNDRKAFLKWLDTMEYEVFKIPRPDIILYLDVSIELTQKLLQDKSLQEQKRYLQGKGDAHETNKEHLEKAKESGLKMVTEMNNWMRVGCVRSEGTMMSIDDIHERIYETLENINI